MTVNSGITVTVSNGVTVKVCGYLIIGSSGVVISARTGTIGTGGAGGSTNCTTGLGTCTSNGASGSSGTSGSSAGSGGGGGGSGACLVADHCITTAGNGGSGGLSATSFTISAYNINNGGTLSTAGTSGSAGSAGSSTTCTGINQMCAGAGGGGGGNGGNGGALVVNYANLIGSGLGTEHANGGFGGSGGTGGTGVDNNPGGTGCSTRTGGVGGTGPAGAGGKGGDAGGASCVANNGVTGNSGTSGSGGSVTNNNVPVSTTLQPITLTVSPGGSPSATFTLSGCSPSPITVLGDGSPHTISVTPSCTMTITAPSSTNSCDVFAGASPTTTVNTCASGTCSTFTTTYYDQSRESFSYAIVGGGSPSAPILSYTYLGGSVTITLTTSPVAIWLDQTTWSATNPLSGGNSTHRWQSPSASGTASAGISVVISYYSQDSQSTSYTVACVGGATCNAPTLTYTQFGEITTSTLTLNPINATIWIDFSTTAHASTTITDDQSDFYSPSPNPTSWFINGRNVIAHPIMYNFLGRSSPILAGSSLYDAADQYTSNTNQSPGSGNTIKPWRNHETSTSCYSVNIVN